jgi:hypothetical protein
MIRRAGLLFLAAMLLPAAAGAQTVAVAAPQATVRAVGPEQLARCGARWTEALARTGLQTVATAGKGRGEAAVVNAEFVASLAIERQGEDVVFTGLASRVRLDRWSARREARAPFTDPAAWDEALDSVADGLAAAVREAPPRETTQPPARPRVKLQPKVPGPVAGAGPARMVPADEPGSVAETGEGEGFAAVPASGAPVDEPGGFSVVEDGDDFAAPPSPAAPAGEPEAGEEVSAPPAD